MLFAALSCLGILRHEMWLDELNTWLAARDSHSFARFLENTNYSGHRGIWDTLLYLFTRVTANPAAMQVFSMLVSTITVVLFLKYSPFPAAYSIAIVFSYFFLYEYNIISRGYNLTWLLLVGYCILFTKPERNYLMLMLILMLLANIHLFSLVVSLPLFGILIYSGARESALNKRAILIYSLAFAVAIGISLISSMPPANAPELLNGAKGLFTPDRFSKTVSFFVKGLYPLPDIHSPYFWNSNFLVVHFKIIAIIITPFLFAIPYILCYDRPLAVIFFYSAVLLVMAFMFTAELFTGVRYMGYAFMILLVTLWLAGDERLKTKKQSALLNKLRILAYKPFITSVLVTQVAAGAYAIYKDYKYPFSEGKEVAAYIKSNAGQNGLIIVVPHSAGPSIAGYMDTGLFYYPDINTFTAYWNRIPLQQTSEQETFARIQHTIDSLQVNSFAIAVATDYDSIGSLKANIERVYNSDRYSIVEQKNFTGAIVRGENYTVYRVRRK